MTINERFDRLDNKMDAVLEAVGQHGSVLAAHSVKINHLEHGAEDAFAGRRHWGGIVVAAIVALLAAGCAAAITVQVAGG